MVRRSLLALGLGVIAATSCTDAKEPAPPPRAERRVFVDAEGLHLVEGHLHTRSLGRDRTTLSRPTVIAAPDRTTLRRDGFDEWYVSRPRGIEQGFTVHERPSGEGPLMVEMEIEGLSVRMLSPRRALFTRGQHRVHYGELHVYDAEGRTVAAHLEGAGARLAIIVRDAGARYPLTIDPLVWIEQQLILADVPVGGDLFGEELALQGDTMVVGAAGRSTGGAVLVFGRTAGVWSQVDELEPTETLSFDRFGAALAIDGDVLVVGAPQYDGAPGLNSGAAWVFTRTAGVWNAGERLPDPPGLVANADLGQAVAVSGGTVVVGAPEDDTAVDNRAGAVLVYVNDGTWTLEQRVELPDALTDDDFGEAVGIVGDTLFVGAKSREVDNGSVIANAGTVEVFGRTNGVWSHVETLKAASPVASGLFGRALAVDGNTLVVGHSRGGTLSGEAAVHVENAGSWATLQDTLVPSVLSISFGSSVAIRGDVALVGDEHLDISSGDAHLFTRSAATWSLSQHLPNPTPGMDESYGRGLAVDGGLAVVGIPSDVPSGTIVSGSALLYGLVGEICATDEACPGGFCSHGFCCNTRCDDGCSQCDAPGSEGSCQMLGEGEVGDCGALLCDGTTILCPESCSVHDDCVAGHYCDGTDCQPLKAEGEVCSAVDQCVSGHCADGRCCDTPCAEQCRACDVAGAEGTCTLVEGAPHPGHAVCEADSCTDGVAHAGFSCAGDDVCTAGVDIACSPYRCGDAACLDRCEIDEQCVGGFICRDGACIGEDPVCTGSVVSHPEGGTEDCAPFRCNDAGSCIDVCTTTAQCVEGRVCNSAGDCVEPQAIGVTDVSCACEIGGAPAASRWAWLVVLAAFATRRRRVG